MIVLAGKEPNRDSSMPASIPTYTSNGFSLVIPAYNEQANIGPIVLRIVASLAPLNIPYEIIVVDDRSKDSTTAEVERMGAMHPVRLLRKQGAQGKAFSLLEGFATAKYQTLGMIDADLQYPPEALPGMLALLASGGDVVVACRLYEKGNFLREFLSNGFTFVFGRLLHGLTCDIQSGLKLFRSTAFDPTQIDPTPWSFDLDFLVAARHKGCTITDYPIEFGKRVEGESHVDVVTTSWELAKAAVKLKFRLRRM